MVKYALTALVGVLVSTAAADNHRLGRRHLHPRHYSVAPVPVYSTVPEASNSESVSTASSATYNTVPEASNSVSLSVPNNTPYHTVPVPSGPVTVPSAGSSSAPYGYGNTTTVVGPTGTAPLSVSTVSVVPVESTPGAGASSVPANGGGYGGGHGGNGGNGQYQTGGVPAGPGSPSSPAGSGGAGGAGECGAATVTVTAPGSTVYVTAGGPSSEASVPAPAGPSSIPAGESESAGSSYVAASHPAAHPTTPVESVGVPPVSSPAPVESVSTHPAYSPKPETSAAPESMPVASESQAPASSVASSSAAPSSSSYTTSGSKRGVVYTDGTDISAFNNEKCGWTWNWNGAPSSDSSLDYVPILNNKDQAGSFATNAKNAIASAPSGGKFVMGPNEPDIAPTDGGSGMPVSQAVDYYSQYIAPMKAQGAKLGSISVTSTQNDANMGLAYLESWKKECDSRGEGTCPVDFVCLHWYGPDESQHVSGEDQGDLFISYMKEQAIPKVNELFGEGTKIWVTEFGANPKLDTDTDATYAKPFMQKAIPYLEGEGQIDRYAYFMAAPGYMVDASGNLTPGGEAYLNA